MVQMIPLMMFFSVFNIFQTFKSGFTLAGGIITTKYFYKITLNRRNKRIKSQKWSNCAFICGHYELYLSESLMCSYIYFLSSLQLFFLLKCHSENVRLYIRNKDL